MPYVAEFARAPDRALRAAADPDLGHRRRLRLRGHAAERPALALVFARAAPEGLHDAERLVAAPAAALERDAHRLVLRRMPAHADAEREEPAAGQLLQRRRLLRQVHRMVQCDECDRGAEFDPLGPAGDPRERDERRVDAPVRIDPVRADDDVLGRPDGVEAQLFRGLGDTADAVRAGALAVVRQDDPEVHQSRLATARVARLATTDPDGRPHLVPIVFALAGETLYSAVDRKPKRSRSLRRIENARRRPDVTVLVDEYGEDWGRLWWARLRGRARVLDAGGEAERALGLLAAKYEQYRDEPPGLPVLAVDVEDWRGWDASA